MAPELDQINAVIFAVTVGSDSLGDTAWPVCNDVSKAFVRIVLIDDTSICCGLNLGVTWSAGTTNTRTVVVDPPVLWEQVKSIRIEHEAAGDDCCADNWAMNGITVTSVSGLQTREELALSRNLIFYCMFHSALVSLSRVLLCS